MHIRTEGEKWLEPETDGRISALNPSLEGLPTSPTSLTALIDQVLMQIKDDTILTWFGKLKGDPNKRSRDKYCCFHWDQDHDTSECHDLK